MQSDRFKQISRQQKKLVNSQWRNQDIAEIKLRTNDFKNFCDVLINITTGNLVFFLFVALENFGKYVILRINGIVQTYCEKK